MSKFRDFFNEVTNDGRIFSYEDVINIPKEEAKFYQEALNYQYGKIGFPRNSQLADSDVIYVDAYTRRDGTNVRAHYRSKNGHLYTDPNKRILGTPQEEKEYIDKFAEDILNNKSRLISQAKTSIAKSSIGEILQPVIIKKPLVANKLSSTTPLSNEYYRIALTKGESIDKHDIQNTKYQIKDIENENLAKHILNMKVKRKINLDDMVVAPKSDSNLTKAVKDSNILKNKIKENKKDILNGNLKNKSISDVNFYEKNDLATVLGQAHIYNPRIDNNGNLHLFVIDWYDFDKLPEATSFIELVNNNAYKQQEEGKLSNYALLIEIIYNKYELEKIMQN